MDKYLKISLFAMIFLLFSCQNDERAYVDIPVEGNEIPITVKRFEQDLFAHQNFSPDSMQYFNETYPDFFPAFVENIIRIGRINDPATGLYLQKFVSDPNIRELYDYTKNKWTDFPDYVRQLQLAFTRYHKVFPEKKIPEIITLISGFNYGIVVDSTYLGLGLDMFLGSDCKYYPMLAIPKYKIKQMNKQNLVPAAINGWLTTEFELDNPDTDLLTKMIHQGKILYTVKSLLPETPDTLIFAFTGKKLQWCEENEEQLWYYLVDNELLYNKEEKQSLRFLADAPFISGLPKESPGRAGQWLGYQIVKKYMTKYPEATLRDLFAIKDGKEILIKSKYKPD
ncbi:MAG TPA: hypothetical protein DIU39_05840 [Flavobacteriales bacterium]|nr:hypothetical protein [Flavobacteriales bacterium]